MSVETNAGVLLAANDNASGGYIQLPTAGSVASPLQVLVNTANRLVFTCVWAFVNITGYTIRFRMTNNNSFNTIVAGKASPAQSGGSVISALNVPIPVGSTAQNDGSPFFSVLDHTYTSGGSVTEDIIEIAGPLIGLVDCLVTTAGPAPTTGDFILIAMDQF